MSRRCCANTRPFDDATREPRRSVDTYEAKMKALGKAIEVHWFDAGHGSLVVDQAIEHHALMLDFARRVLEGR